MGDEEKFTNRHGHTVSSFKEALDILPEPEYRAAPKPPKRRKRRTFRLSRVQKLALVGVLIVVVAVPVVVGEYVRGAYAQDVEAAKSSLAKLLSQQTDSTTGQTLKGVDTELATIRDNLCPGGFLDNLAKLYPRAQQAYDECAAYRSSIAALESLVSSAAEQMIYLEQLQPLLDGVSQPLEDQFAVLSAQQENWQDFVDGLGRLSVPAAFKAAHDGLATQASAVHDQWIALAQASNSEDSIAFREARTKLTEGFAALRAQSAQFSAAVSDTQTVITEAISSL